MYVVVFQQVRIIQQGLNPNNLKTSLFQLRDSGEKSFSKKKCEKRAGAGERQGETGRPPPPFPSRARLIFALLDLIRPLYTS